MTTFRYLCGDVSIVNSVPTAIDAALSRPSMGVWAFCNDQGLKVDHAGHDFHCSNKPSCGYSRRWTPGELKKLQLAVSGNLTA